LAERSRSDASLFAKGLRFGALGRNIQIAWRSADDSDTRHEIRDDGISRSDLVDCDAQSS
jgi:hypothetical protein